MPRIFRKISFFLFLIFLQFNLLAAQTEDNLNEVEDSTHHVFKYADPSSKGFSVEKLDSLSRRLDSNGSSALLVMVDGKIIFEWGETRKKHTIHSIRKPLINALYGIKVKEGVIDTCATLRDLGIDDIAPSVSKNEKNARIVDLLKSRSGIFHDAAAVSEGMLRGRPVRDFFKPGEHYYYNNWDFNVLGAILEQQTGKSVFELFKKEIAVPLGMEAYEGSYSSINGESEMAEIPEGDGFYQFEKSKSKFPAYHFRLSARDMALFGQLYLNKGIWEDERIIPEEWIEASTKAYSVTNNQYGIGYGMLWRIRMQTESRPEKSFYHTGAGIHMLGIYPASKLVLVHRVDTENAFSFKDSVHKIVELIFGAREDK